MSGRLLRHKALLTKVAARQVSSLRKAANNQLGILIELFLNIGHLSFTQREQKYLSRRLSLIRDISKIRSARTARKVLQEELKTVLPILAKAALLIA